MARLSDSTPPALRHFYVPDALKEGVTVPLGKELSSRLRTVLRAKEGFRVALFNGDGTLWEAEITHNKCSEAVVQGLLHQAQPKQMPHITLAYGLPKRDANALILRMGTELGVMTFAPLTTDYTVRSSLNTERAQRITQEAAEQCERLTLPTILETQPLEGFLTQNTTPLVYGAARSGERPLSQLNVASGQGIVALIGAEGGFSDAEMALLGKHPHAHKISLAPHVLRADTAVATILGAIHSHLD